MAEQTSESLHKAIDQALKAGDFDRIRELSVLLGQAIIREAELAVGPRRQAMVDQGLHRLGEHLNLARVLRAHVVSQLQTNTALSVYQPNAHEGHSWTFNA